MFSGICQFFDHSIARYPKIMDRLRYFYIFGCAVALALTWELTVLRLDEPLPNMAYVFSLATTSDLSVALIFVLIGEATWKLKRLSWIVYDWLLWASIVFAVQSLAAFSATLGFEFCYGVTRREGINLGVITILIALSSWIFLFWRMCVVTEGQQRRLNEILLRKQMIRIAGA